MKLAYDSRCTLAEGPVWDGRDLWFVDIASSHLFRSHTCWKLPCRASALALRADDSLLLATENGLADFDPRTGDFRPRGPLEERAGNRSNDAGVDPHGNFWVGTMDDAEEEATGALWRIRPQDMTRMLSGIRIANTVVFSGEHLYFADSAAQIIWRFRVTPKGLQDREVFATVNDAYPDGSALDDEGFLWNAQWDGHRVVRYAPSGEVDRIVELPVKRPTSCAFSHDTLFVTSASIGDDHPWAGGVIALDVGIGGPAQPRTCL